MPMRSLVAACLCGLLSAACASVSEPLGDTSTSTDGTESPAVLSEPLFVVDIAGAVAMNVADGPDGNPVLSWTDERGVWVAIVDLETGTAPNETMVSGGATPFLHPIERPAVTVTADGTIDVAFTSLDEGGSVYHSTLHHGEVTGPKVISGNPRPETVLVHSHLTDSQSLIFAWLEDSSLTIALEEDGQIVETDNVDDMTCDCCNPVPQTIGGALVVAYRDLDRIDGEVVRDVVAMRSADGGASFETPVPIADDHWFIDACPFSGPAVAEMGDQLIVAWMDGRQSVHPDQTSSSIWVDISTDGGATFGEDLEVSGVGINHWPVIAVDSNGVVHLVWEVQGADGGLAYSLSEDRGSSFTEPVIVVGTSGGLPKSPSLVMQDGLLLLTWTDREGGHLTVWET